MSAVLAASNTGEAIGFWVLAPIAVLAALAMVTAKNAVHCALFLAAVMLSLAGLYALQDAPFLAAVQVIVYTGAILMLFLFVLMLVGVDSADSLVETLRGQRIWALVLGVGFAGLAVRLLRHPARAAALRLYLSSLAYLALLFCAMAVDALL